MSKSFKVIKSWEIKFGYDNEQPMDFKEALTEQITEEVTSPGGYISKQPDPSKLLDLVFKIIDTLSESQIKEIAKSYGWNIHKS